MEALDLALDSAQTELAAAEIGLAEATARAVSAREGQARLKAAVAALSGEPPPAAPAASTQGDDAAFQAEGDGSSPSRSSIQALTPEEFDAQRKRKQRKREKELIAQYPYGTIKCTGCGVVGKLNETLIQAPSGVPVKMLICAGCGNQTMI